MIDHLDPEQKQKLLRLLIEEVRVTGWNVQIQLRIPLDAESQDQPPPNDQPHVSSQDRLRSIRGADVGVVQEPVDGRGGEGLGHELVESGWVEVRGDRHGAFLDQQSSVSYLTSPDGSYVTGAVLDINGGFLVR